MTVVDSINAISHFLKKEVCDKVEFLLPPKDRLDGKNYKPQYVHPSVYPLYVPKNNTMEPNALSVLPYISVQFMEGSDDIPASQTETKFMLEFAIWRPGDYEFISNAKLLNVTTVADSTKMSFEADMSNEFIRNHNGWMDVWNFVEVTKKTLLRKVVVADKMSLKLNEKVKYGVYSKDGAVFDFYPMWYAWMSFTMTHLLQVVEKDDFL